MAPPSCQVRPGSRVLPWRSVTTPRASATSARSGPWAGAATAVLSPPGRAVPPWVDPSGPSTWWDHEARLLGCPCRGPVRHPPAAVGCQKLIRPRRDKAACSGPTRRDRQVARRRERPSSPRAVCGNRRIAIVERRQQPLSLHGHLAQLARQVHLLFAHLARRRSYDRTTSRRPPSRQRI